MLIDCLVSERKRGQKWGKISINSSLIKCTVIQSLIFLTLLLIIGGIRKRTNIQLTDLFFSINLNLRIGDKNSSTQ